ncbi:hypothetical protein OG311_33190 [Streptomyces sp. NBC_01343]|uniref:hypothetical protein n=1 Tax=Streptomyces sp. NBC_01343 TaxID=2903832 RepID=UPI002E123F1C|nr:hypothetical protein OG311_33190 [Streptomyces sp. NBC_01343]
MPFPDAGDDALAAQPPGLAGSALRWPDGDRLFRIGRLTRRQAVEATDWGPVRDVMRTLAGVHGDEGVRLVVWFDC